MVEDYDNRAIYHEVNATYKSPVLTMPIDEIETYIGRRRKAHGEFTRELLGGDMLSKEQFIDSVKLGIDVREADRRLGRRI